MKKNLLALFVCMLVPGLAFGYDSPNGKCYAEHVPGQTTYDFVVYFENDRPRTGENDLAAVTGLADCVGELKTKLNEIALGDDMRILLLATTDKKASHQYNDALSDRRLAIVKGLFDSKYASKIITHRGGETNDHYTGTGNNRNPAERAVKILIANQQQIETLISSAAEHKTNASVTIYKGNAETSAQRIRNIVSNLNGMTRDFGASVWTTKDGNFNTSRLVSDSLAGVVLGTAGGLITSNVIKKNQIKGGFEDIKCTVGGQVVAEFGDDFMVGIQ